MQFLTAWKYERRYAWLVSALGVGGCAMLAAALLYIGTSLFYLIIPAAVLLAALVPAVLIRRARVKGRELPDAPEEKAQKIYDRAARRSVNWLLITFIRVFSIVLGMISRSVNYKLAELSKLVTEHMVSLAVVTFFLVKNLLLLALLRRIRELDKFRDFRREFRIVLIFSLIYWGVSVPLFYAFEQFFVLNIAGALIAVFAVVSVLYNFIRIKRLTYSSGKYVRAVIAVVSAVALLIGAYKYLSRDIWLTQPYINATPYIYNGKSEINYDDATGIYTVTKPEGDFRILQLTDIHLGGGALSYDKDLLALKAVFALLEYTKPDLVIVTGDLCYPVGLSSFSFNNTAPVQQFAAFMRNTGIPWAFTYGNHDTESYAASSKNSLNELYKSLSWKTGRTLMYPYVQPDVTGRSNQLIELRNKDGTLNNALFLIDSNAYTGEGLNRYDYIHDDQVEWYRGEVARLSAEAGGTVPSLVFFHIPLQQYKTAYELYKNGDESVRFYFGSAKESASGTVCCSEYPSGMFDAAKALGSTTGFFCGHDHYNNFSIEYEGIRLTYGMSIDYLADPGIARDTAQRGATLITVHDDGGADIEQVPLTSVPEK